ncbi:uncharacterized protein LOC143581216 [Bidens hawaiensis]|uniref:uncharacterized protein LOC143581216 n=1 Tax=Bidens hawaiensis TaxID=980011 RepID=UPI00404ABDB2
MAVARRKNKQQSVAVANDSTGGSRGLRWCLRLLSRIECGLMSSQSLSCETVVHSIKNELLVATEFNCIAEINKLKKVQNVILLGTIKSIEKKDLWYYLGCSYCMCKVDQVWTLGPKSDGSSQTALESEITCGSDKCKTRDTSVIPRFRVTVTLQDSTGVCFLMLFGAVAIKLLNISAEDLMSLYGKDHTSDAFWPSELETLVDRKLAFKVQVTEYNQNKPSNYFKDGESFSFDIDDQQTINLKESVSSFTGQNETPGSVSYKDSGKALALVGGSTKRNLNEVYDVEEYEATSSTKARNISKDLLNVSNSANAKEQRNKRKMKLDSKRQKSYSNNLNNSLPTNSKGKDNIQFGLTSPLENRCMFLQKEHMLGILNEVTPQRTLPNNSFTDARSPFSDITNSSGIVKNNTNYKEKRKDRRIILDSKREKSVSNQSSHRLSSRSLILNKAQVSKGRSNYSNVSTDAISKDYLDHGDQSVECEVCHAKLWPSEAKHSKKMSGLTCYFLCCHYGKVELPYYKEALQCYQDLFTGVDQKSNDSTIASTSSDDNDDIELINYLKIMLDSNNVLVQTYRMVRDCFKDNPQAEVRLRLIGGRQQDGRTYNLPTSSEVVALIVGDIGDCLEKREIVVNTQDGSLKRISELHPSYMPLQYPIFFSYGDDGYRVDIYHRAVIETNKNKRGQLTMREFFAYRIQDRANNFSLITNGGRLYQQLLVDAYTSIESESIGQRVILPSSFTGGARYMRENYLDAMAICKWFGHPDFFITMTCSPKWPEVKRFFNQKNLKAEDRPDICCRLFKIKLNSFVTDLKEGSLFGKVKAVVCTIEFQKRGLPHAHACVFMHHDYKINNADKIDSFISTEIPNKQEDPELYDLVSEFMIHGPCGAENMSCSCMINKKCSKNFPKSFSDHTSVDSNGYPIYRRREDGVFVKKSDVNLDNRSVVPYSPKLLKRYHAHINVEWCNQSGSIKYLFKYINKGPDRATAFLEQSGGTEDDPEQPVDEIKEYYDYRYVSACEASWRIFSYEVHYRTPSVVRLPFHLPGQQHIVYGEEEDIDDVLDKASVSESMFTDWMTINGMDPEARKLSYVEFPSHFVWKTQERKWQQRKKGCSIGRIHSVSPAAGEGYYLRILLNKVKGPTKFEDIRTVNGNILPTFRDACYELGLLDDDNEYTECIVEASNAVYRDQKLFGRKHGIIWQKILFTNNSSFWIVQDLSINEEQIKNLTLLEIEKILLRNNSSLRRFNTMPFPDLESVDSANNRLIIEETCYDRESLQHEFDTLFVSLTDEQRGVYNEINKAVEKKKGGVFFVYGYRGTGKTFLWKTLASSVISKGLIVLNVASSGIASLLLTGGRTAHSRFKIPINLTEDSICSFDPQSEVADLIKQTSLIIWDEAPMIHKHAFEAMDRTFKDILKSDSLFGGKVVVFGGDFRQILPVVTNGSRHQLVNASLSSSYIWKYCKVLKLTKNMRIIKRRIFFQERAILAPKKEVVQEINDILLARFPGEHKELLSSDSIGKSESVNEDFDPSLYSPDVLNGLKFPGCSNHQLILKVGVPVMLLRNIDQKNGLCNGTRLIVKSLGNRIIDVEVVSGSEIGKRHAIHRVTLNPTDKKFPFKFSRRQFPLSVCFAMTINKS